MAERTPIGTAETENDVQPLVPFDKWVERGGEAAPDVTPKQQEGIDQGLTHEQIDALITDAEAAELDAHENSKWGDVVWTANDKGKKAETGKPPNSTIPRPWSGIDQYIKASGGKEQQALLNKMKKLVPYRWSNQQQPIQLTPLVQFYMVRYLGPYLYQYTDAALERTKIRTAKKSTSKRTASQRIKGLIKQVQMDEAGKLTAIPLAGESDLNLDSIFPFHRLKTLLGGDEPNYGMIQQYHSILKSGEKADFLKAIFKIADMVPEELVDDEYILPVEGYREGICAWLEETSSSDDEKAGSISFFDDPFADKSKKIMRGALLDVPGIKLLLAETAGNHKLFASSLDFEYREIDFSSIDDRSGYWYLIGLAEIIFEQGENRYDLKATLDEILSYSYDVIITELKQQAHSIVIAEDMEYRVVLQLKQPPVSGRTGAEKAANQWIRHSALHKGEKLGDRQYPGLIMTKNFAGNLKKLLSSEKASDETKEAVQWVFAFDDKFKEIDTTVSWKLSGNTITDDDQYGWMVLVEEEGMNEQEAVEEDAMKFNAAGQIIEQIMEDNAVQASMGTDKQPVSTQYDEIIAALIGNSSFPGIATYHALWHFNYLVAQLQSPFANWNVEKEGVMGGRLLAVEAYFGSPAKLLLYWMLNFRSYIDWGATDNDGTPLFFRAPTDPTTQLEITAFEKNKLAHLMIGYYRLAFAMLATREVITTTKVKPKMAADIKAYWNKLVTDSAKDPPAADKFVMTLSYTFGSLRAGTARTDIPHPTWMPPPAETIEMSSKAHSQELVGKYLKWAYGQDPVSITWFGEVAAAYHAAKAISSGKTYPEMVENFIEAIDIDGGHAFLFAILLNPKSDRSAIPERPPQTMVIKDIEKIGGRAVPPLDGGDGDGDFSDIDDSGGDGGDGGDSEVVEEVDEVDEVEVEEAEPEVAVVTENDPVALENIAALIRDNSPGVIEYIDSSRGLTPEMKSQLIGFFNQAQDDEARSTMAEGVEETRRQLLAAADEDDPFAAADLLSGDDAR